MKIYKKGKAPKNEKKDVPMQKPQFIQLTRPEAALYRTLTAMRIPYKLYAQFKQPVPGGSHPYLMDFAYPEISVDIEADGGKWHTAPEDKKRDLERDVKLANLGWRVIRFTEDALADKIDNVKQVIYKEIVDASNEKRKMNKKAQSISTKISQVEIDGLVITKLVEE